MDKLIIGFIFFMFLSFGSAYADKATYLSKGCLACHGANAEGNKALNSPSIAGLDAKYLKRQLTNFNAKKRGYHPQDIHGKTMQGMSAVLTPADIDKLATYLSGLKPGKHAPTLGGDAAKGKAKYVTCIACHGPNAQGNPALNAPNLAGLQDWYIVNQLKKFKGKIRGADAAKEPIAMQMQAFAISLSEGDMKNIAAYIVSLGK